MTRLRFDKATEQWVPVKGQALLYFKPLETPQLTPAQAEAIGAHFDGRDGITTISTEKQLREHLARERDIGRDVRWRENDDRSYKRR